MIIGVPKEIKNNENRVAMTPAGVSEVIKQGHQVLVQNTAGLGSGFAEEDYAKVGAEIAVEAEEVWKRADMIVKVKEPLKEEYPYFRENLTLFTYLHLAAEEELTKALLDSRVLAIAYETIEDGSGALPLLQPMSEIAGRMATQVGARFLQKNEGGKGVLLGGVPGVLPANVTIVGGGMVGVNSAKIAIGMGADVTIVDKSLDRLRYLDDIFGIKIKTLYSNSYNIAGAVKKTDLLIAAVLIPGAKAPKLVTAEMVKTMSKGSVIVDVAVDQGGCVETINRVTTHANPVYEEYGVVHYAVTNMPGAVARTSTYALTNATLPYILNFANLGVMAVIASNKLVAKGVNTYNGYCSYKAVADTFNLNYHPIESLI